MDRMRVLIADDQVSVRQGLKALLATWPNIEVVGAAANGEEAVQLTEKYRPDVALMDIQMPVMDGLEATCLIKSRWPQVRIVALTMYPLYQTNALNAGADAFLVKGCASSELARAIQGDVVMNQES
jgi:DNA-binding NarL/FixJ family response regulator